MMPEVMNVGGLNKRCPPKKVSNNGEIPVLCDTSPCFYRMQTTLDERLHLFEPMIEFAPIHLMDRLTFTQKDVSRIPYRSILYLVDEASESREK